VKKIIITVAAIAAMVAVAHGWSRFGGARAKPADIKTARVERGSIQTSVACTGRVVPNLDVEIKCKASGRVTTLPFDVSDSVKEGDLLLKLDPIDEQRMVRQAEAALAASQARLDTARTNLSVARRDFATQQLRAQANLKSAKAHATDARAKAQRMKELLAKKLTSPEEAETAETNAAQLEVDLELAQIQIDELKTKEEALDLKVHDVKLAEAQVESDKVALEIRQQGRDDTEVVSPINGVVSSRSVEPGQIISSGISNVGGGTTTMVVSDLSSIFVLASVDESDIGSVVVGEPAGITADAFPGKAFSGRVVRIATQGVNTSNVVTFEVKIEVLSENKSLLKPEMTANLMITAARRNNVLLVPVQAVVRKGKEHFVEVVGDTDTKAERKVEVGLSDGTKREIIGGLTEGEAVVVHTENTDGRWSGQKQMGPPPPPM
jgi:HlyD family secretion protein